MNLEDKKLQLRWWADKKKIPAQYKGLRDACQIGVEAIDWAQRRIQELLEANDRYLERARAAEAALASTPPPSSPRLTKAQAALYERVKDERGLLVRELSASENRTAHKLADMKLIALDGAIASRGPYNQAAQNDQVWVLYEDKYPSPQPREAGSDTPDP